MKGIEQKSTLFFETLRNWVGFTSLDLFVVIFL